MISDLDSDAFEDRERAAGALRSLGEEAEPHLSAALRGDLSAEGRRRIDNLLDAFSGPRLFPTGERARAFRGIAVLERIGSIKAIRLLHEIADRHPRIIERTGAHAALNRIRRR